MHIGRHQYHSEELWRTLPPDGTPTAWSTAHPTDPGRLPLPGSVLGLLRTPGRTLPRDGGEILKLANYIAVDRLRHRTHQQFTSRVRDVRAAEEPASDGVRSSPLPRPGFPAQMGRIPPSIIDGLPSQQLSCRHWSEDDETNHHRQDWSEGRTGH